MHCDSFMKGICYGFQVLHVCESPNIPFTILFERFEKGMHIAIILCMMHNYYCLYHVAPEVVIYDNGCNLHSYCLNREPDHFKFTWFVVDRFHWPNHTGMCICTIILS